MSIYLLSREFDRVNARVQLDRLCDKGATVELTERKPLRSIPQNRYLHLILGWFALNYGETRDYVKQEFFKRTVNPELFVYERVNHKTGEVRQALRSTGELDTRQMTAAIERFRNWSAKEVGIYLPAPNEDRYMKQLMRYLEMYDNKLYV